MRPDRWPVFTVDLASGHRIHLVWRNFDGDAGWDYLLAGDAFSEPVPLALLEGHFRGPGLSWPELVTVAHQGSTALDSAQRLLLVLPALGDLDLPEQAADIVMGAVTAVGAIRREEEVAAELLAASGRFWDAQPWTDRDGAPTCLGQHSFRGLAASADHRQAIAAWWSHRWPDHASWQGDLQATTGADVYAALVAEVGGAPNRRASVFEAEVERILASLRGQPLEAVTVYQHWFDNAPNGEVTGFWLHFRDRPTYYVSGDGSGQALRVSPGEPGAPVDMEHFGQMRVHPATAGHPLVGLVGHRIMDAEPICSRVQGCKSGLRLRFDHASIIVMQYCDDLWIILGETPPTVPVDHITIGTWNGDLAHN